jgi:hypothetical protein
MKQRRFFTKTTTDSRNVKLFVLLIDDENKTFHELLLTEGFAKETSEAMGLIIDGSPLIQEISEKEAQRLYPLIDISDLISEYENE